MTSFQPGDKVRRIGPSCRWGNQAVYHGATYTVSGIRKGGPDTVTLEETRDTHWDAKSFVPVDPGRAPRVTVEDDEPGSRVPEVLIVDPSPAHLRAYDFKAGDQRFFDREEALKQAQLRVKDRGCRQQVRRAFLADEHDAALTPPWLVQDI